MRNDRDFDQILFNSLFTILWALSRPFVWIYRLSKWFIVSVTKETGHKVVKIVGAMIAFGIVGAFLQFFK